MRHFSFLGAATAAVFIVQGTFAWAGTTAQQIWQEWQNLATAAGGTLTVAAKEKSGATLTVGGLTLKAVFKGGSMTALFDPITLQNRSDGTVQISFSPDYRVEFLVNPKEGKSADIKLRFASTGLSIIANGTPDARTYNYLAVDLKAIVDSVMADNKPVAFNATLDFQNLSGGEKITTTSANRYGYASHSAVETLAFNLAGEAPDAKGGKFVASGTAHGLTTAFKSSGLVPLGSGLSGLQNMLKTGFSIDAKIGSRDSSYTMTASGPKGELQITESTGAGAGHLVLDSNALSYKASGKDLKYSASGSAIPLPKIDISLAEAGFNLLLPIKKTDGPVDFAFGTTLRNLVVNDLLWSVIDRQAALPHGPATFTIDLAGKARWLVDLLANPGALGKNSGAPGELDALTIKNLEVTAVGASLTGNGKFAFNNDNRTMYAGMPQPIGAAHLKLVGGNGLLDKLTTMGLLPKDQATGFRMMLGIFAKPGAGKDTLVSDVEMTPDGGITANGMKIK